MDTNSGASSISGALLERAEELVKRDHGAGAWDKWLEMSRREGRRGKEGWLREASNQSLVTFFF